MKFGDSLLYIGANAFNDCTNLNEIRFSSSIEKIGESAFKYCALDSFTFPASLKYVGKNPIGSSTSDPIQCEYEGTTAQWIAISEDAKMVSASSSNSIYRFTYTVECVDGMIGSNGNVK